jgi:nucleotide-binding universal stress UspA family protein
MRDAVRSIMFAKILCPIDFSPSSEYAAQVASRIAAESRAELVLVHVFREPSLAGLKYPIGADAIPHARHEAEKQLALAEREVSRLGAERLTSRLLSGAPWDQIVQTLEGDRAFDLAVVGSRGRAAIARFLLGSVAEKVVRHAPCSVLVARSRGVVGDAKPFGHVLCATDFSDASRPALARAGELAARGGAGITLFHAIEPVLVAGDQMLPADILADVDKRAAHAIEELAVELRASAPVQVTSAIDTGGAAQRALAVLDADTTFDLAVVGSHGRTGIGRALIGSVAERIVRHAPCSVLVARARG